MTVTTLQQQNFNLFEQLIDKEKLEDTGSMIIDVSQANDVEVDVICFNGDHWHLTLSQRHYNHNMQMRVMVDYKEQKINLLSFKYDTQYQSKESGVPVLELEEALAQWLHIIHEAL